MNLDLLTCGLRSAPVASHRDRGTTRKTVTQSICLHSQRLARKMIFALADHPARQCNRSVMLFGGYRIAYRLERYFHGFSCSEKAMLPGEFKFDTGSVYFKSSINGRHENSDWPSCLTYGNGFQCRALCTGCSLIEVYNPASILLMQWPGPSRREYPLQPCE